LVNSDPFLPVYVGGTGGVGEEKWGALKFFKQKRGGLEMRKQ